MKRKSFDKFVTRNVHKRAAKDKARRELMKMVEECGIRADGAKLYDVTDGGRRSRISSKQRSDEFSAFGIYSSPSATFGFVSSAEYGEVFIPDGKEGGALDGDTVEVIFHRYNDREGGERTEGRVVRIAEQGRKYAVGVLEELIYRHGSRRMREIRFIPDDKRLGRGIRVREVMRASAGEKVEVRLIRGGLLECDVIRSFGDAETVGANYSAVLAEFEIPEEFDPDELTEAERAASEQVVTQGRELPSREVIFTMDSADALDLDDAVSLSRTPGGGFRLGVHIADVSHYVKQKSVLDRCAMARGTSVYFADRVVPMLPPALSNGSCSLNPGEDKYAISAVIKLSPDGRILDTKLSRTVIRSRVKGVYSELNQLLEGTLPTPVLRKYKEIQPSLLRMKELYEILHERRVERGYIDFESDEARIRLDEKGDPVGIEKVSRGICERIIEEFMLVANQAVAELLHREGIPCVYRVHDMPPKEKFDDFVNYAHNLGFDTEFITKSDPCAKKLGVLLEKAEEKGLLYPISYAMLRSMAKARYSDVPSKHFGLELDYYCHFTSPIRRLSDLATHRIINAYLDGKSTEAYRAYARRAAAAATDGELRALGAERRIEELFKTVYMSRYIGSRFEGVISSVASFGFFVRLENTVEGLVPISDLDGVFDFDEKNCALISRRECYRLADAVTVRLEECDLLRARIRFSVV